MDICNIFEWIGDNLLAIIVAICTAIYTVINYKMLIESRKTRLQKITPHIIAYLDFTEVEHRIIALNIKNIGEGMAKNVSFKIINDYKWNHLVALSERGAFASGISSFVPEFTLTYTFGIPFNDIEATQDAYIELEISYEDIISNHYSNKYMLRFKELLDQGIVKPPVSFKPALIYWLAKIEKNIENLIHIQSDVNNTLSRKEEKSI